MVTVWIALTEVTDIDHSPLLFANGSHRDYALPYWYSVQGMSRHSGRTYPLVSHAPLSPGDATMHHGWTIHGAPPNFSGRTRKAFAISYISEGSRRFRTIGRRQRHDGEDAESYANWLPSIRPGAIIRHRDVPLVWRDPAAGPQGVEGRSVQECARPQEREGKGRQTLGVFEMAKLELPVYL
eukprot:Tamp_22717.p1 GENE.Tamp_22717~~Tamp_22717.p1  ORF type:complete len:182 (+),score=5.12 Tamp_22717:494-1039(+)